MKTFKNPYKDLTFGQLLDLSPEEQLLSDIHGKIDKGMTTSEILEHKVKVFTERNAGRTITASQLKTQTHQFWKPIIKKAISQRK